MAHRCEWPTHVKTIVFKNRPMCINLHFPKFNNSCHFSDHLTNLSWSCRFAVILFSCVTFCLPVKYPFTGISKLSYHLRLRKCGFLSLQDRSKRADMLEVFKIINGFTDIDTKKIFELNYIDTSQCYDTTTD